MTSANQSFFETTGIGSLPHHNVDAALAFAFSTTLPFLPQIPVRNPWEFMLAQALEGLPGIQVEKDGAIRLNLDIWESQNKSFTHALKDAFSRAPSDPLAFAAFEPSPAISSCWQPFVWELQERELSQAKIQIAGPLTCQWSLQMTRQGVTPNRADSLVKNHPTIASQIFQLVLARALAMTRRLQAARVAPLLFLDEPGLYGLTSSDALHHLALHELKLVIKALQKEGVSVGLHCCSNTDWNAVLSLGLNVLSLDTALSLKSFLAPQRKDLIEAFIAAGGRLSLGVISTALSTRFASLNVESLFTQLLQTFSESNHSADFVQKVLMEALYTPACGLALHSVTDAQQVLELLAEFRNYCFQALPQGRR